MAKVVGHVEPSPGRSLMIRIANQYCEFHAADG
jgi:hypothetical protein